MPHRASGAGVFAASAILVATASAITGCTSRGGVVTDPIEGISPMRILVPSPGSSAFARIVQSSDGVLQAHLLKLSNLPHGWKQGTGSGPVGDVSCAALSAPAYDRLPLHAETGFTSSSGLPSLSETLAYGTTSQVQAVSSCGRFTMRLEGQTLSLTLKQIPLTRSGDARDARQAETATGRAATVYFVVIRKGDLVESVTYADWGGPDTSEVRRLVDSADIATAGIR